MKGDIMTGSEILDLLKYGERLTLECKKLREVFQMHFGKRTLHLPIPVEV